MTKAYYNEFDPKAAAWLRELIKQGFVTPGDVDERSILDVKTKDLEGYTQCHFFAGIGVWSHALRQAGWPDSRPVWTGSCPCQGFSTAGKQLGFKDPRHLWPAWFKLISKCRPATIFGEQVEAAVRHGWLDLVQADLEGEDYAVGAVGLPACGFGAPHIRQRLWFVAEPNQGRRRRRRRAPDGAGRSDWAQAQRNQMHGEPAGVGEVSRLAESEHVRHSGSLQASPGESGRRAGELGVRGEAGGMGDASGAGLPVREREDLRGAGRGQERGAVEQPGEAPGRPGPTNGFWEAADRIFCRDGKWRPVEPIHVKMVDGPAPILGRSGSQGNAGQEEAGVKGALSEVREGSGPEKNQRKVGRCRSLSPKEALQPEVHVHGDGGGHQESHPAQLPSAISQEGEGAVRALRPSADVYSDVRPSPGPGCDEQQPAQLEDLVRLLSPSLSLAQLHGDRNTAKALRLLHIAVCEAGSVLYPSQSPEAVWASLSQEAKDRIAMGVDVARWVVVVPSPLAVGSPARAGRLRGYGNACCSPVAIEFIKAYTT